MGLMKLLAVIAGEPSWRFRKGWLLAVRAARNAA